jgi:hypothetical protein
MRRCRICPSAIKKTALPLQGQHVGHEIVLLLLRQLHAEHDVEELHRVGERQQSPIMQVGWRVLDTAKRERLDRPVGDGDLVVGDRAGL